MTEREPVLAGSLFVVTACAAGGYYEFISAIIAVFAILVLFICRSRGEETLQAENGLLFPFLLVLFYAIASFYATDSGMAWTGVIKKCVPFLFACILWKMTREQRRQMLEKLPEYACITVGAAVIAMCIPSLRSHILMAGRFAGTFGYANTYALFLLLSLLVLLEYGRNRKKQYAIAEGVILLAALWLTGSRFTWLLAIGVFAVVLLRYGKKKKWYGLFLGAFLVATAAAATIFRNTEAIGRLFTTNASTLYGRFLYWIDALKLIRMHPFGMGYLGYYYEQTRIQTGVYTVRYIHNDWLQWILDIGVIPAVILLACLIYALVNRKRPFLERLLIAVILLHGCMEFDLEHNVILMVLVLILSCEEEPVCAGHTLRWKPLWSQCALMLTGVVCLYFAIPLTMYALGDTKGAAAWYPAYTDAQITNLSLEEDPEAAEQLADRILKENSTVALAYDAKAMVAYLQSDWESMFTYKKEAIARNKFDADEYQQALLMLQAMQEETGETDLVQQRTEEIQALARTNEQKVSRLGKMIDDQVDLDLESQMQN